MAGFANIIGREEVSDYLLPDQVINEVIQTAPESSAILARARTVRMSAKRAKQPVLAALPDAYWVGGDTGLKQTTNMAWQGVYITAEELAVIVPIPNTIIDDANVPLWTEVRPLLTEAIGRKIDQAALFGEDAPESWPEAIVPAAIAAGNSVAMGTGADIGVDVSDLAGLVDSDGFAINGFASRPGLSWRLRGLRDLNGQPLFGGSLSQGGTFDFFGFPLQEVRTGAWDSEQAEMIAADWTKFVVGIRQDITYSMFSEGVISDDEGKVVLNLMQQDSQAMRVTMRVGFQVANPLTRLNADEASRYPAGVLTPGAASGGNGGSGGGETTG